MIRPARPGDAAAYAALVQAGYDSYRSFAPAGWRPPEETSPERVDALARYLALPGTFARVEASGGALTGLVGWSPAGPEAAFRDGTLPDAYLDALFVAPARWGDGLARELHDLAVAAMAERGVRVARLVTPALQARSRAFYARRGWRQRGEVFPDDRGLGLDLVEYALAIGSPPT